jgi:hypothetical protein
MSLAARALAGLTSAATLAAALVTGWAPAYADEPAPALVTWRALSAPGVPLAGAFTVTADVVMNASSTVTVTPQALLNPDEKYSLAPSIRPEPRTVTTQDCPQACVLRWTVDPTTRTVAWGSGLGWVSGFVAADGASLVSPSGVSARYIPPVADLRVVQTYERPETVITRDYLPTVLDTGGVLTATSTVPRSAGEVLHVSVRTLGKSPTEVASATGPWGAPDATGATAGRVTLDTAKLPEGEYGVHTQSRNAAGQWSVDRYSPLEVRHAPVNSWLPIQPILLGSKVDLWLQARTYALGYSPWTVKVSIDGGAPAELRSSPAGSDVYSSTLFTIPAAQLPLGTHSVTATVFDYDGNPVGAAAVTKIPVVTFTETISHAPLVVGDQPTVTIKGTAPAGLTYSGCDFKFLDAAGTNPYADGTVCWHQQSFTYAVHPIVRVAGPARFELTPQTTTGLTMTRTFPATVYAARAATWTAPTSSAYGAKLTATIKVTDRTNYAKAPTAKAGVAVTLQRKAAGTSTWVSLGTVKTEAYGKAVIAFTNTASGRLRAMITSAVPGRTITTTERAITSVSVVTWSSLPSAVRSGGVLTAAVYAKPYEKGAAVRVQARALGTTSWTTFTSAPVSSTGYTKPTARLYTRGTWEVRVLRVATTQRANGYSPIRRVSVR